ncbi:MAG: hypothetical protein ACI8W7_004118 [Gammaproteobacteria bacterium]|jgi:hypothetical protein
MIVRRVAGGWSRLRQIRSRATSRLQQFARGCASVGNCATMRSSMANPIMTVALTHPGSGERSETIRQALPYGVGFCRVSRAASWRRMSRTRLLCCYGGAGRLSTMIAPINSAAMQLTSADE